MSNVEDNSHVVVQQTAPKNSDDPHGSEQFKPNTTVAIVVACQDKFLLVEEKEHGKTVYNQPAGHLEADENLVNAAMRELEEETGVQATPEHLCGIYYYYRADIDLYYLRFCFVIEFDTFVACQPQDDDIIACHWLSLAEIKAKSAQLRSPLVLECIEDHLSGKKIPLSHLKSNL